MSFYNVYGVVVIRVRPEIDEDYETLTGERYQSCLKVDPTVSKTLSLKKPFHDARHFEYDAILGSSVSQVVYSNVEHMGIVHF